MEQQETEQEENIQVGYRTESTFDWLKLKKEEPYCNSLKEKYRLIIHCHIDKIITIIYGGFHGIYLNKDTFHSIGCFAIGFLKQKEFMYNVDISFVRKFAGNAKHKPDVPSRLQAALYAYDKLLNEPKSVKFSHLPIKDVDSIIEYIINDEIISNGLHKLTVNEELHNKAKLYNCLRILFSDIQLHIQKDTSV